MRIIHDLGEMTEPEKIPKAMLAIAVHIGTIRLTDNIVWRGDGDWLL
jgi:pantothenate synthetase